MSAAYQGASTQESAARHAQGSSSPLPVLLDAMGGDHAPKVTLEAARLACERGLGPITLVGDPARLELPAHGGLPEGVSLLEASEVIGMSEMPTHVVRRKPNSSMHVGMRALRDGEGCAFVTAGNSGAAVAVGLVTLKRVAGCERPAIASLMPSLHEPVVLLDMGANVSCKPKHLVQFALMGSTYASHVLKRERPRVALLSNGHEASKGTDELRRAHQQLTQLDLNYLGYLEPQALPMGRCDVFVTDGFVGNVALKLSEGVVEALMQRIKRQLGQRWWSRLIAPLLKRALAPLREEVDWRSVGGAPVLGLTSTVMICHGSSDAEALCAAIERARAYASLSLPQALERALEASPLGANVSSTSEIINPTATPSDPALPSSATLTPSSDA